MAQEVTTRATTAVAAGADETAQMWLGLLDVMKDPATDPAKMSALLDVQNRILESQFNRAMLQAMANMPMVTRNGAIKNKDGRVQSRYARFEDIDRIVRPIAAAAGLGYNFDIGQAGALVTVTCIVGHVSGFTKRYGPMSLPLDASGSKNGTQGAVSSASYGKRATLSAAFNIITEGDDTDGVPKTADFPWTDDLLFSGRKAALGGLDAYTRWFQTQTNQGRGWMMDKGHHAELKAKGADVDSGADLG